MAMVGSVYFSGCAPTLQVVSRVPSGGTIVNTGVDCCSQLNCSGYDGCTNETEKWENGAWQVKCHCYSVPSPSTSSSSSGDHDHGGYDRDRGDSGGHSSDRSGHCESRGAH